MINADMLSRLQDYFNTGRYDQAVRFLEEQKNASPELNSVGALITIGHIMYFQNSFEQTRERFLAALKKNLRHLQAKFFLARSVERREKRFGSIPVTQALVPLRDCIIVTKNLY